MGTGLGKKESKLSQHSEQCPLPQWTFINGTHKRFFSLSFCHLRTQFKIYLFPNLVSLFVVVALFSVGHSLFSFRSCSPSILLQLTLLLSWPQDLLLSVIQILFLCSSPCKSGGISSPTGMPDLATKAIKGLGFLFSWEGRHNDCGKKFGKIWQYQ